MKIGAPSIIASATVRQDTANALASGQSVWLHPSTEPGVSSVAYPVDLVREIEAGRLKIAGLQLDKAACDHLNRQGMMVGGGTGLVVGAGIGILLDQLRAVAPKTALVFDAACALVGCGLGAAVGSGQFTVEGTVENGTFGVKVAPVIPK